MSNEELKDNGTAEETAVNQVETEATNSETAETPAVEATPEEASEKTEETESTPVAEISAEATTETPAVEATSEEESKVENEPIAEAPTTDSATEESTKEEAVEESVDYASLSKDELVEISQKLVAEESDFRKIDEVLRHLKLEFDSRNQKLREEALKIFVAGGGAGDFKYTQDKPTDTFYDNYKTLKTRKHQYFENLEKEKAKNLNLKQQIIVQIKELTEQDITKAVSDKVKSLQENWKEIGAVPQADADNLYKSYKALLDQFYAKKSMEHELIRLDREKNLKAKTELCEKAKALISEENINEAVGKLNTLHQEYKAIGHVPREKQEEIWQRFKKASDEIYDKKRAYIEELKKSLEENMKLKQELCLKIETYADYNSEQINEWNETTKEVLALQEAWDKIGPVPREVAKTINKQFWGNFKGFFNNKHKFFEALEETRKANLKLKQELCEQVEAIQDSFDWNEVADKLKELQAKWKEIGPVPQAQREEVYQRFKKACDHFFNRKRNRRAEQDKEFAYNKEKKTKISADIKALDATVENAVSQLDELVESWFKVGFVPREDMNAVQDDLSEAVEAFVSKSSLSDSEKDEKLFDLQKKFMLVGGGKGNSNKKEQAIRRKMTNLENDIALWRNNLEFFASSKTADKLRDEFNTKIEKANGQLVKLKAQLRAFDQIRKQADAEKAQKNEKKAAAQEA